MCAYFSFVNSVIIVPQDTGIYSHEEPDTKASKIISTMFVRSPPLFYLPTVGVEVVYFPLITLRHTSQSVGPLWTRDLPVAETSTWQHEHSQKTNIHAPASIRSHDRGTCLAADLRLRRRGHWDPHFHNDRTQITCRLVVVDTWHELMHSLNTGRGTLLEKALATWCFTFKPKLIQYF
jgi:hypothetical protein